MNNDRIIHKTINGLLKRGYTPDKAIIADIKKTVTRDSNINKKDPYYILALVCDYGFLIGMNRE